MQYKCVMGNDMKGVANCTTHGFVRCFKITATTSLQTQIRIMERDNYKHQLIVQDTRGEISGEKLMTVDLEAELPTRMKEAMTRTEGYVFKVRAGEKRKEEGTGGLDLKIMAIVEKSHENKVEGHNLEEMVQKEIVRVYERKEDTETKKGAMDDTRREEEEEGTAEIIPPPMSRTRSERKREENNKRILIQAKNNRRALVCEFNASVEQNEKEAISTNKVQERAKSLGYWVKRNFISWCCPQAFCDKDECMFVWCPKCYDNI